jgi:lipopolysaccharide transport system ATP-binding protein
MSGPPAEARPRERDPDIRVVAAGDSLAKREPVKARELVDAQKLAIVVKGATLRYPVGPVSKGSLKAGLFQLFGKGEKRVAPKFVDAIKNLDLSIQHGERVALIGRNGSGKSSLLRALAGIYPMQIGAVHVIGRVGTLLDVTLGFEVEATGRENIYNRGMAMGLSPKQLRAFEHEIVEFAGLGEFIDLPMRTYSAGMYVRLGFAISTQFSPDILLIDEVFGAGDAEFARRAIGRMNQIVNNAGIVVIATHDMNLVNHICTRAIWMNEGRIEADGPPASATKLYMQSVSQD